MSFPENCRYTKDHEWIRLDSDSIAYVGITDFAQSELGDIVYVEVETVGEKIEANKPFGLVEAVKTTSDLYMPVNGEILEFNPLLDQNHGDNPVLINNDPYGEGWIVKIALTNPKDFDGLMNYEEYQKIVG
jgi:glycine cleavage system H protein